MSLQALSLFSFSMFFKFTYKVTNFQRDTQEILLKIALLQSVKTAENSRKPQSGFPDVVTLQL